MTSTDCLFRMTSAALLLGLGACQTAGVSPGTGSQVKPPVVGVMVGAGDIASCGSDRDEATAALLERVEGTVFTLGDHAYPDGTREDFERCYAPGWGRHKQRTRPTPGNHEYHSAGAEPYFDYFGAAAGERGKGYYSYEVGTWHVVVLNSQEPMGPGSEQEQWLREELDANPSPCTLAYWHRPLFSSGPERDTGEVKALWDVLYEAGADVVLGGHDHFYERFAPQTPEGRADPERGIRQFVVGTGGMVLYPLGAVEANSEVREANTFGLLKLTLEEGAYAWEFLAVEGDFKDEGRGTCH
jgi:hypothetical protein